MTNQDAEPQSAGTGVSEQLARHGGLSYLEIPALDIQQSASFYEKVFGWRLHWRRADDPSFEEDRKSVV